MRLHPLALAALLLTTAGACGSPRPLGEMAAQAPPRVASSSAHYRSFADADALAVYLRWRPGAPVLVSAHRGGPTPGLPENALAAFEHALNFAPALVEVDVRPAADGTLLLLHDDTLDRTTTGTGPLAAQTATDLRRLRLRDTEGRPTPFPLPTLAEAFAWAEHRAILMLDVKRGVAPEALVEAIRQHGAENRVVVIVYTLDALLAYHALAPDLNYSITAETEAELAAHLSAPVDVDRLIVFAGVGQADRRVVERAHAAGLRVQAGAFGALDAAAAAAGPTAYAPLLDAGVDVLATDVVPVAAIAAREATTAATPTH